MTYYPDLSPCTYFDHDLTAEWWASYLIAVGWLDPEQTKPHCDVPPPDEILDTLFNLVTDSWPPIGFLGYHPCGFCPGAPPRTATEVNYKGRTYTVGDSNILVPGPGKVFVAPSLVVHYVLEHGYRLPVEFCSALSSPPQAAEPMLKPLGAMAHRPFGCETSLASLVSGWRWQLPPLECFLIVAP